MVRWGVAVVLVLHGLIHLLGAAKGLGWAEVPQLRRPISRARGVAWLGAGALVTLSAVLLGVGVAWWWTVGVVALVTSQTMIFTAWGDAKAGTAGNLLLLAAVVQGLAT